MQYMWINQVPQFLGGRVRGIFGNLPDGGDKKICFALNAVIQPPPKQLVAFYQCHSEFALCTLVIS